MTRIGTFLYFDSLHEREPLLCLVLRFHSSRLTSFNQNDRCRNYFKWLSVCFQHEFESEELREFLFPGNQIFYLENNPNSNLEMHENKRDPEHEMNIDQKKPGSMKIRQP